MQAIRLDNERRLLRMKQARQRSKEVAAKVLQSIRKEEKILEERTNIFKQNRYLNWYRTVAEKDIVGNPESIFDNEYSLELRNDDGNSLHGKKEDVKNENKEKRKQHPTYKQFRDEKEKKILSKSNCGQRENNKHEKNKIKLNKKYSKTNNPATMHCGNCNEIYEETENDIPILLLSSSQSDISKSMSMSMSSSDSDSDEELRHTKQNKRKLNSNKKKKVNLSRPTLVNIETMSSPPVKDVQTEESIKLLRPFTQITDFVKLHLKPTTTNERINEQEPTTSAPFKESNVKIEKESIIKEHPSLQTLYNRKKAKTKNLQSDNKVQFYDYTNKFKTSYERPVDIIQNSEILSEVNAGHVADVDLKREELKRQNANVLMQKCEQRSQKVLEKDKIQREVSYLTAKLDAVQNIMHRYCAGNILSDAHMRKLENIKQGKMNEAIEEVLKYPVLITCPEVRATSTDTKKEDKTDIKMNTINVGKETKKSSLQKKEKLLDSSDSCASIILKPLHKDTNNVAEGNVADLSLSSISLLIQSLENRIHNIKNSNGEIFDEKMKQFSDLAKFLLKTLKQYEKIKGHDEDTEEIENKLQKCIEQFQETNKKFQKFLSENVPKGQKQNEVLPEKESNCFEKKKPEESERCHQKVEIVLKVEHENEQKNFKKTKPRNLRVRACLINTPEMDQRKRGPRYKKKTPQVRFLSENDFSTSTSYLSPPNQISTKLNKAIDNLQQPKDKVIQKQYYEQEKRPKIIRSSSGEDAQKTSQKPRNQKGQINSNEIPLSNYVKRLLGMAPDSIKCLEVTSSEISTPNSIVNRKSNRSEGTEAKVLNNEDLMSRFLKHSFHENSNESLENMSHKSTLISSRLPTGRVWMDLLKYGKDNSTQSSLLKISSQVEISSGSEKSLKSILKKSSTNSEGNISNKIPDQLETENLTVPESKEYTEKIANIEKELDKVRKERQKILETSLQLNNEEDEEDHTEYLDLPSSRKFSKIPANVTRKVRQDIRLEELEKISQEKNKATRVSHDSGISLSRPVTAQGSRGTPDIRTPEIINIYINDENIVDSGQGESSKLQKTSMHTPTSSESDRTKKNKPPSSINKYSPQLADNPPHELSTIVEVETPGTSVIQKGKGTPRDSYDDNDPYKMRSEKILNEAAYDLRVVESFRKILENCVNTKSTVKLNLPHYKLPSFEEFLKVKHTQLLKTPSLSSLNLSKCADSSLPLSESIRRVITEFHEQHPLPKFEDILKKNNLPTFKEFLGKKRLINDLNKNSMRTSTSDESINYKNMKINESSAKISNDVQDSNNTASSNKNTPSSSSSSSIGLPDIVAELLKRNIFPKGFAGFEDSPSLHQRSSKTDESFSDNNVNYEDGICNRKKSEFTAPRRKRNFYCRHLQYSKEFTSSDSTKSEEIDEDLNEIELEWAKVMLHRNKISPSKRNEKPLGQSKDSIQPKFNKVKSGSSGIQSEEKRTSTEVTTSSQTDEPFNLQSFIKRQLEKEIELTSSDMKLSSSSLSEAATSNLSNYLPESSQSVLVKDNLKHKHTIETQKASTPISDSTNLTSSSQSVNFNRLFSIESEISSVLLNTEPNDSS